MGNKDLMDTTNLLKNVEDDFAKRYYNFSEFSTSEKYKPIWDLCIETLKREDYVKIIRFCNDSYKMPPVRVFIDINKTKIDEIAQLDINEELFTKSDKSYLMKTFLKQSLGAFWGMVFRFGLDYKDRKTVTMIKADYYGIATASRFEKTISKGKGKEEDKEKLLWLQMNQ